MMFGRFSGKGLRRIICFPSPLRLSAHHYSCTQLPTQAQSPPPARPAPASNKKGID